MSVGKMKLPKNKANQNQLSSDYQWLLMQGISQYKGQWIAVLDRAVVARDNKLKAVLKTVSGLQLRTIPLYLRVPDGSITA